MEHKRVAIGNTVHGNVSGLASAARKALDKLYSRRLGSGELVTQDFATQLTFISHDVNRLVAVLVDRRGKVDSVIVGDAQRVYLPDIGRQRAGSGRFRGLRLIRSHLSGEALGSEDLADLSKLRLDAIVSVEVGSAGYPGAFHWAHLVPENPDSKLWETYWAESAAKLGVDFTRFIAELEGEFQRKASRLVSTGGEPAMLIYVEHSGVRKEVVAVPELLELARTAGIEIRETVVQRRASPDPRFVVGKGKLEQIVLSALQQDVGLLIFGCDLAPRQLRAITDATDLRVIDRTQLILDIFAQRAQSLDGKLQVELAQLKYTLPRLISKNTGMSRLEGGIGGRGPGETKLEINRRRAHDRIRKLDGKLAQLSAARSNRRARRQQNRVPVVSIVGYTNAGKSTLLNRLTNADVLSEDKLFATLDPTTRRLRFPEDREVVLTDTVGFIHDLPKDLVAAFKATLEELEEADLLLHLIDASEDGYEDRIKAVNKILDGLGLGAKEQIRVFNKIDRMDPAEATALAREFDAHPISALDAATTKPLLHEIDRRLFFSDRAP